MITVLVYYERISLYHTMVPFFLRNYENKKPVFHFTQSVEWCLTKDKNTVLFMERWFQHRQPRDLEDSDFELLRKLRDKYKKIVFFCGQPEAGNNRMDILPYVDKLFYKSIFTDRDNYCKKLYGKNLFSDYYHNQYGINDDPIYIIKSEVNRQDAVKPELSWNIGLGTYPRYHWPQRLGTAMARASMPGFGKLIGGKTQKRAKLPGAGKPPKDFSGSARSISVHARIQPVTCPSIAYQRVLFLECIKALPEDKQQFFITGRVAQNKYYNELADSKITLSPFGWGEVCFRDFEAILAGSLLFKPDMSHLVTWPDVYIPYETYIPLKWDGSDLLEKTERYLDDEKERNRITVNALDQYRSEMQGLSQRTDLIMNSLQL
ncbi:MAG: glycosyltransferase [Treponema sp.]|jgi:hypothetical protein|nr:glycosyltransferase [Treponema sp.]